MSDTTDPEISSFVLLDYKNMGKFLQKTISNKASSSNNIQKTSKYSNRNTQKK